jgi:CMP-N-acetylneuraminic acid synthetase
MRAYALIPARAGSKGLPDKNVIPIGGHPLLAWSIAFARKIPVERVILSTDSEAYAALGRRYGAEVPALRDAAAASDTAMEEDILADLHATLPGLGIPLPDVWVWLKPTCPFRDVAAVEQALGVLRDRPAVDAVRIVSEADARLHRINAEGWLEPLLPGWDPARSKVRRSEFPKVFQPFNLEVFRHQGWLHRGPLFMGRRIHPIVLPRITGLDVDDRDGFELIRALIESNPRAEIVARHLHEPAPALPPASDQVAATIAALRAEAKPGEAAREVLSRARFAIAATRAAAEAVLAAEPGHGSALRVLAKCQSRAGEHAAAAATLRALMRRMTVGQETRRELRRLDLLAGQSSPDPAPPAEAVRLDPLAAAADAATRAVADGARPDRAGFGALLRQAFDAALRDAAGALPPALMALRRARDVAIVGNGPSLKGSGAGAAIEAHGVVLRFNFPVLSGHEADVGRRTDAMILAGAKRGFLATLLEREPAYRRVPAMVAEHRPAEGRPVPPPIPLPILRLVWQAGYAGPTSGFTGILLTVLLLNRPATLFGFDFFAPGEPGHYFGEAAAALQHETGFERWYVTRFLPAIRPGIRFHAPG